MTCFKLSTGETVRSYCIRNGINYHRMYWRLERHGLTPEQAIDYCRSKGRPIKKRIDGLPLKEYAQKYGLTMRQVYYLVNKKKKEEQATNENI